ncbi:MAG: MazG nucleotide pyrophosphohydrolase domain-containing protein [Candidatus Berkiellales bacterium]
MDLFNKVIALDKMATDYGFTWTHHSQLIEQLLSECKEVEEVIDAPEKRAHLEEELGDLMFTAIALCIFCHFDPHSTIDKSLQKFEKRFNKMKEIVTEEGYKTLKNQPMEVLKEFWDKAKKAVS